MGPLLPLTIIVPVEVFYFWMFHKMLNNESLSSDPWSLLNIAWGHNLTTSPRYRWTMAFILLNVFAAGLYYVTEYRRRY